MDIGQSNSDVADHLNTSGGQSTLTDVKITSGRNTRQNGSENGMDDSQSPMGGDSIDPRKEANSISTEGAADLGKQNPAANETIKLFLVDDHQLVVEGLIALAKQDKGIEIVGYCNHAWEVLKKVGDTKPDVLALDIGLPGLNGLQVCRMVKQKLPETQILMLTMHNDEQVVINAFEYGATGYLVKDAVLEDFYKAVHTVARGETYLSPGIPSTVLDKIKRL